MSQAEGEGWSHVVRPGREGSERSQAGYWMYLIWLRLVL